MHEAAYINPDRKLQRLYGVAIQGCPRHEDSGIIDHYLGIRCAFCQRRDCFLPGKIKMNRDDPVTILFDKWPCGMHISNRGIDFRRTLAQKYIRYGSADSAVRARNNRYLVLDVIP